MPQVRCQIRIQTENQTLNILARSSNIAGDACANTQNPGGAAPATTAQMYLQDTGTAAGGRVTGGEAASRAGVFLTQPTGQATFLVRVFGFGFEVWQCVAVFSLFSQCIPGPMLHLLASAAHTLRWP